MSLVSSIPHRSIDCAALLSTKAIVESANDEGRGAQRS
jgi:hypothetical protein